MNLAELFVQQKENSSTVNQLVAQQENFMILRLRAALDYPRSQSMHEYSESQRNDQPRFLQVCSDSRCHTIAMLWIKEVEIANSLDDLVTSQSIEGRNFPDSEMLDAKI